MKCNYKRRRPKSDPFLRAIIPFVASEIMAGYIKSFNTEECIMHTEEKANKRPDFLPLNAKESLYECPHCHARPYISLHNCPAKPICHMCGEKLVKKGESI